MSGGWYYAKGDEKVGPVEDEEFGVLMAMGKITGEMLVWTSGMDGWKPLSQTPQALALKSSRLDRGVLVRVIKTAIPNSKPRTSQPSGEWYYARGDEKVGPVDDARMRKLIDAGEINGKTLVWTSGMDQWKPMARIPEVMRLGMPFREVSEPNLKGSLAVEGGCSRRYEKAIRHASVGSRTGAMILDIFLVAGVLEALGFQGFLKGALMAPILIWPAIIIMMLHPDTFVGIFMILFVSGVVSSVYQFIFTWIPWHATPGKKILHLKVVRSDGSPVDLAHALLRGVGFCISVLLLGFGFVVALFTGQKQALHDLIADTVVIRDDG